MNKNLKINFQKKIIFIVIQQTKNKSVLFKSNVVNIFNNFAISNKI